MNYQEIAALALAAYETIARALPTSKNLSLIHKVLKALVFVSTFLNIKKGPGKNQMPTVTVFLFAISGFLFSISFASCKSIETVTCKSTKHIEVTVLKDGNYYSATVPVCDTVLIVTKPKMSNK